VIKKGWNNVCVVEQVPCDYDERTICLGRGAMVNKKSLLYQKPESITALTMM
jgi:hypothetical protein